MTQNDESIATHLQEMVQRAKAFGEEMQRLGVEVTPQPDPVKTYYRVWWEYGGYRHFDTLYEAENARHYRKGRPARIDKIQTIWMRDGWDQK